MSTRIITAPARLSFPALWTPKPRARGVDKLTYQATFLFPPTTDLKPLHAAVEEAMLAKWNKAIKFAVGRHPVKHCGDYPYGGYEQGWHFVATHSDRPIGIVDAANVPLAVDDERVFPGCWVRGIIKAYAWEHPTGGKGVSFDLEAVQYLKPGERIGGRGNAASSFGEVNVDDLPF